MKVVIQLDIIYLQQSYILKPILLFIIKKLSSFKIDYKYYKLGKNSVLINYQLFKKK